MSKQTHAMTTTLWTDKEEANPTTNTGARIELDCDVIYQDKARLSEIVSDILSTDTPIAYLGIGAEGIN